MCMERDLLYRYFDGDTTPDEERRSMERAEASPENYRLSLEERRLWCAVLLHAGRRTARRPALWRRLAAWRVSGAAACILLLVGLIYIIETLSVILQVTYFKATHGKRIFKMAPLHHHFELCGWSEVKLVAVFTSVSALCCLAALFGVLNRFHF